MASKKWAVMETDFLFDARVRQLTPPQFKAYVYYWLKSVDCGKETLSRDDSAPNSVSTLIGVRPNSVRTLFEVCRNSDEPLVVMGEDGRVTVRGSSRLHPGMVFANLTLPDQTLPDHTSSEPSSKVLEMWTKATGRNLRKSESAQLQSLVIQHGAERIEYAIGEALTYGVTSLHYVRKVAASAKTAASVPDRSLTDRASEFE